MARAPEVPAAAAAETPTTETETAVTTIFAELYNCACIQDSKLAGQNAKETDQKFLMRVMGAISDVAEEHFNAMSEDAQGWYNENAAHAAEKHDLTLPDGFVSKFGSKAAPAAPKPKPKEPRAEGIVSKARRIVIENHDKGTDVIKAAIVAALPDIKPATVSVVMSDTMGTINLIKELKHWK